MTRRTPYPLPAYSYVTGHFPHPLRDPKGHGCRGPDEPRGRPDAEKWAECDMYLWANDLFDAGYYWEAHEAWECLWHTAGRQGPTADFFKALIKLAAAGVKARENRPDGVRRHARRAEQLLSKVRQQAADDRYWGQSLRRLSQAARDIHDTAASLTEAAVGDIGQHVLPLDLE